MDQQGVVLIKQERDREEIIAEVVSLSALRSATIDEIIRKRFRIMLVSRMYSIEIVLFLNNISHLIFVLFSELESII